MGRKSLAIIVTTLVVCLVFTGCIQEQSASTAASETETSTAHPTATPTHAPAVGLDAVFGKEDITITVISNSGETESQLFFKGAQKEAQSMGVTLHTVAAPNNFDAMVSETAQDGTDAMIAYLADPPASYDALAVSESGLPVCVFEMQKGAVPAGVSHVFYNPDDEVDLAFNAALVYPPHDTPVRLILMFESRETKAYTSYETLFSEGKIFPKEVYIAAEDDGKAPQAWLEKKMENYIEGMLDGVFAENADLAFSAGDAFDALGRTDIEVFGIGVTPDITARMSENPNVFAQTVGPNTVLAGALCVRAALSGLAGGDTISLEIMPGVISAADFEPDMVDALTACDDTQSLLLGEDWMDGLREYYAE